MGVDRTRISARASVLRKRKIEGMPLAFVNQKNQQNNGHEERHTPHQDFEALDERRSCHVISANLHR
jgi:hypothetical protein